MPWIRHAGRPVGALLALGCLLAILASWAPPRADLAEFLPPGRTPGSAFLLRELQSGSATTVLLAAIEGDVPREELARLSRETAAGLRGAGHFAFVGDGTLRLSAAEEATLFRYRYLLSPETRPEAFTTEALRSRLETLLDGLRSAGSPLLARFGFADPTGAFLGLAGVWLGASRVETFDGAWFAPTTTGAPPRVLLVARSLGAGLDSAAQETAMQKFQAAFAAANPPEAARLLLSGPGVFAAAAAAAIEADVRIVTIASASLLAAFLIWRFRSGILLALVAAPLAAATLAGYATTVAVFGTVHAIALGFGMTMLGVAVDYPILLLTLRRPEETLGAAAQRIWPSLRLAAVAAATGLLAMVASGLPGLVQLGVFAGTGLLTAAATTRWLLPLLAPPGVDIAARRLPMPLVAALGALRGRRGWAWAAILTAAAILLVTGGPAWQRDLAALSPVPVAQQAFDGELRAQLGAPDVRGLFVIGPFGTEAEVLRRAEALEEAVVPLVGRGLLAAIESPSRYLPSPETQRARGGALPYPATLEQALRMAGAGLPFRPGAFAPFVSAVDESRALPPLEMATLAAAAPTIAARLAPLLTRHGNEVWGIAPATSVPDAVALERAATELGLQGVVFLDVKLEMERLLADHGSSTIWWGLVGGAAVLVLLAIGLRGLRPALRTATPIAGAVLVALAGLTLAGEALSLFHLASLLLLAGLAIDYSLFVAQAEVMSGDRTSGGVDRAAEDRLGAVLSCAVSTMLTFGLLALCQTPVLHGIGLTVVIGVAGAFLLACALVPRHAFEAAGR